MRIFATVVVCVPFGIAIGVILAGCSAVTPTCKVVDVLHDACAVVRVHQPDGTIEELDARDLTQAARAKAAARAREKKP